MCFSKNDPRPFGVHKEVKWALFEPIASYFGHSRPTKCLELQNALKMGGFATKNESKMDQKMCFSKDIFGLFGLHKQVK